MYKSYYYHFNGHGDTIALTDNSGKVAQTYKYDIWGNLLESSGSVENPFTYGGQWGYIYDSESNLYFLKTRYYDASIGRFTSRDRFAGFENDSDSQNRYVYCQNDPVGNVDPAGESVISVVLGILGSYLSWYLLFQFKKWAIVLAITATIITFVYLITSYNIQLSKNRKSYKNGRINLGQYNKRLKEIKREFKWNMTWFAAGAVLLILTIIGGEYQFGVRLLCRTIAALGVSLPSIISIYDIVTTAASYKNKTYFWLGY